MVGGTGHSATCPLECLRAIADVTCAIWNLEDARRRRNVLEKASCKADASCDASFLEKVLLLLLATTLAGGKYGECVMNVWVWFGLALHQPAWGLSPSRVGRRLGIGA